MKKLYPFLVFVFVFFLSAHNLLAQWEEHYIRFTINNKSELDQLTRVMAIDDVKGNTVYAYLNAKQWASFKTMNYPMEELPYPDEDIKHEMTNEPLSKLSWDAYPTYQAYRAMMRQYAADFPAICMLDTIGNSTQGRQLLAVKISNNVHERKDKPKFFYTSTMHGNETVGFIMTLRLIDFLLHNYNDTTADGKRATNLVNNIEIWINPLSNPDGAYYNGGDTSVNHARRYNANNVDLNRNFPDRIQDTVNTGTGREAETKAMMAFERKHWFNLSANFHTGTCVVNYPYDGGAASGTYVTCPDDAWFIHLSKAYSLTSSDMVTGEFAPTGITNGNQWYSIYGGRQDWMYHWYGGRETTIELWNDYNPAGSTLPARWASNKEGLLAYMEEALKGIRGIVTDDQSGVPVKARIDVQQIANSPVYSDSAIGDYHRFILPGTYTLIVSAPGNLPDTLRNIVVTDTAVTRVNVQLHKITSAVDGEARATASRFTLAQNYPNPFNPNTVIRYSLMVNSVVQLKVYNIYGQEVATLINKKMEAGTHSVEFNAAGLPSGMYFYRLQAGTFIETRKLVLMK